MSEQDLIHLLGRRGVASWRQSLGRWVESGPVQTFIIAVILLNGLILGLETSDALMATLHRMESDLATLRSHINKEKRD